MTPNNERIYFIVTDILHTGHHGPKGVSKIGKNKYSKRKNKKIWLYSPLSQYKEHIGESIRILDGDEEGDCTFLITTPLVDLRESEDIVELETENSVYILKRVGVAENEI